MIFLIAILVATTARGQHKDPVVKDDVIHITSKLQGDSLFTEIGKRLAKAGFPLTVTKKEFGQISTGVLNLSDYSFGYSMVISIEKNAATMKPTIATSGILGTYRWYYIKHKGTINYKMQEHLLSVLAELGDVGYSKE